MDLVGVGRVRTPEAPSLLCPLALSPKSSQLEGFCSGPFSPFVVPKSQNPLSSTCPGWLNTGREPFTVSWSSPLDMRCLGQSWGHGSGHP